ncbi:EAL domain-containing protein [Aeromonas enteropelogenes]|uniref:EAL domain-containing protein n=1 Tax=Aeromonas enteropelogenes TaxID=29489 RepID=UPI003B9E172A
MIRGACPLLSDRISDDLLLSWNSVTLPLKTQKIISMKDMECVGYEVLLNLSPAFISSLGAHDKFILNGCALEHTLNFLHRTPKSKSYGKKIFINIDRSNLCNKIFLRKIVALFNSLHQRYNIELVIEITERNICGFCLSIAEGMSFLVKNGVSLAVDDFDIYSGDFRCLEVDLDMYKYIKIEVPKTEEEYSLLDSFINDNKKGRIVIERIESQEQLNNINVQEIYACQGYFFHKADSIVSF